MDTISHSQRYLPHELSTKFHAVKLYHTGVGIAFVCRRYKISKSSLLRWNKKFDSTKASLLDKSHCPRTPHPNSHSELELKWIQDYKRRNPTMSVCELYGKLRTNRGYTQHPGSLYRVCRRLGYTNNVPSTKKAYKPKPYDTPTMIGEKGQLDAKYVPRACYTVTVQQKYYQYTYIDEASRERFIYPYMEYSSHTAVDFVKRVIMYFGYVPKIIQTDNGNEFTHSGPRPTIIIHPFDVFYMQEGITYQLIRPRTPYHNGKVERSHRSDQERFYNHLKFYSYADLLVQMKRYRNKSNDIPMSVLGWKSPIEKRKELQSLM